MIPGIDVSAYQGVIDWPAVAASGVRWCYVRAYEGVTPDPRHAANVAGARRAGLRVGSYQFLRPRHDGTRMADMLCSLPDLGDLPPCVDVESDDGVDLVHHAADLLTWLDRVEQLTGRVPLVYVGPWYASTHRLGELPWLASRPLWVAQYGPRVTVPAPWSAWTAWQYSGDGRCPGVQGACDLDWAVEGWV